jgi:hypothetical protein
MTSTNDPRRRDQPGYRGALPTRNDRLARPWIIAVVVIFLAIFVLSALEIPSRFAAEPTPLPIPSIPATPSAEPTDSASPEPDPSGSGSPDASGSASPSPTPAP